MCDSSVCEWSDFLMTRWLVGAETGIGMQVYVSSESAFLTSVHIGSLLSRDI